jgi:hypothetical protein
MVGGMASLPQARGMDGGESDSDDGQQEVYVGERRTKRRKKGHGDKVGYPSVWGGLLLDAGCGGGQPCPCALLRQIRSYQSTNFVGLPRECAQAGSRDWIVRKKAQQRARGYTNIKPDSRYTGRKRKDRF